MKSTIITIIALLTLAGNICAEDKAIDVSKTHLSAFLRGNFDELKDTYSNKVVLMPGHEFLKNEYGLSDDPGRSIAAEVERDELIKAIQVATEGRPARPAEKIAALMESLEFKVLNTQEGDFAFPSSDPVNTSDSKLNFKIKEGDALVKAAPPKGDFILLQLRKAEGVWRVVAEYLD